MSDSISTMLNRVVFHTGYRTAAIFVANGVGMLVMFGFLTAHAIAAQTNGFPQPTMIDMWGITLRDIVASLGSAGAAYGFMLFRVKKLEDEMNLKVSREHLDLVTHAHKTEVSHIASVLGTVREELARLRDVQTEHYKEMIRNQVRQQGS